MCSSSFTCARSAGKQKRFECEKRAGKRAGTKEAAWCRGPTHQHCHNALHHQSRIANRSPIAAQATLGLVVAVLHDVVADDGHAREQQRGHVAFAFALAGAGVGKGGEGRKDGDPAAPVRAVSATW